MSTTQKDPPTRPTKGHTMLSRTDGLTDDAGPKGVEGVSDDPRRLVEAEVRERPHVPGAVRVTRVRPLRVRCPPALPVSPGPETENAHGPPSLPS